MSVAQKQTVIVLKNELPQAGVKMRDVLNRILETTAVNITAKTIQNTPPRVDTGAMMASWTWERVTDSLYVVFSDQEHSIYNEFGTVRMAAHPMIRPAAAAEFPKMMQRIMTELPGVFRR